MILKNYKRIKTKVRKNRIVTWQKINLVQFKLFLLARGDVWNSYFTFPHFFSIVLFFALLRSFIIFLFSFLYLTSNVRTTFDSSMSDSSHFIYLFFQFLFIQIYLIYLNFHSIFLLFVAASIIVIKLLDNSDMTIGLHSIIQLFHALYNVIINSLARYNETYCKLFLNNFF